MHQSRRGTRTYCIGHGLVEAVLLADVLDDLGVGRLAAAAGDQLGRVAGESEEQEEHQRDAAPQDEEQLEEPADDEGGHGEW